MRLRTLMLLPAAVLLLTGTSYAQDAPQPPASDPIEQLRLAPEQRQRIRMIFEETKTERQQINRRVREANVALDQALDTEPTDQNLIDQRLNELAAAQTAQMRMRIQTELKIRRELRPEQLATLRQLRLQARDFMGAQRPRNQRPARRNALRP
ncbi:MAG TPA: periplasmic heavy metal sensor [Pyrinomonadaceae bacterium]|nr:periplasmic heavy metal sensor [Pyrinomonadaceae bacterium]